MALPGKTNPFTHGLVEEPPATGLLAKKTFIKIPLSTGSGELAASSVEHGPTSTTKSDHKKKTFSRGIRPDTVLREKTSSATSQSQVVTGKSGPEAQQRPEGKLSPEERPQRDATQPRKVHLSARKEQVPFFIPDALMGKIPVNQLSGLLLEGTLSRESLEDSLRAFAYDLNENLLEESLEICLVNLICNFMCGDFYYSPRYVEACVAELKEALEEQDNRRVAAHIKQRELRAIAEEAFEDLKLKIDKWIHELSSDEKSKLLGEGGFMQGVSVSTQRVHLQHKFLEQNGLIKEFNRLQELLN